MANKFSLCSGDFDGVSEQAYKSAWLLNEGPQTLTGVNSLANVDASAVTFQGTYIDNVDIGRLHTMTAKIDEQTTLNSTTFGKQLHGVRHLFEWTGGGEEVQSLVPFEIHAYLLFQLRWSHYLQLPWMELSKAGIFMSRPCSLPQHIKGLVVSTLLYHDKVVSIFFFF